MAEKVEFKKIVLDRTEFANTVNTDFTQLGNVTSINEVIPTQPDVNEFFNLYNTLFYDIPQFGDVKSHQYIVEQSGRYINFNQVDEDLQALQDEISSLREQLLEANQTIIDLQTSFTSFNTGV